MAKRMIDWGSARDPIPERGDRFTVVAPLRGKEDSGWKHALHLELRQMRDQVRGGSWGEVEVHEYEIRVTRVAKSCGNALKEFLNECIDRANERSEARDHLMQRQAAQAQSRDEQQEAQAGELGRELRED